MMTRLKELAFAAILSPAVYYWGFEGTIFFTVCLSIYVISHLSHDCELVAAASESKKDT
ncbi:MAG: hypothetical protein GY725_17785 [bacterium]|nr:hypothetical protein [bacterium]